MSPTLAAPAPLTGRLPAVPGGEARLARTVFDRRFTRWVDQLLSARGGAAATPARLRPAQGAASVAVCLVCQHGELELTAPASAWPTLELAAALPDAALARDVAEALLAEPLALLAPWLPGLALRTLQPRPQATTATELCWGDGRVGLRALDEGVARHLAREMRRAAAADLSPLRGLRLPARLCLGRRELPLAELRTLATGDVIACAAQPADGGLRCRFLIGLGTFMQATAETGLDSHTATLTEAPSLEREPATTGVPLEAPSLGALHVPVSFEVDSARVALDDLAAFGPGSVVTLDAPVCDALVRLVCFGQVVGTGRLVAVGDCLGVRIERIGLADDVAMGAGA